MLLHVDKGWSFGENFYSFLGLEGKKKQDGVHQNMKDELNCCCFLCNPFPNFEINFFLEVKHMHVFVLCYFAVLHLLC